MSPARYFRAVGYAHTTTGGNCTAYTRTLKRAGLYVLITTANDAMAPDKMDEPAAAGLYAESTGHQLAAIERPSCEALVQAIERGEWQAYDSNKPGGGQ